MALDNVFFDIVLLLEISLDAHVTWVLGQVGQLKMESFGNLPHSYFWVISEDGLDFETHRRSDRRSGCLYLRWERKVKAKLAHPRRY
jgi:hypothetical protein